MIENSEIAGYSILQLIGKGGMGNVYKAWHPQLARYAAIKVLHQKDMNRRMKNEAIVQSSATHTGIAALYEYISTPDLHCIIMEYVEGATIEELIKKKKKLSNKETADIVLQIASILDYLHSKGIIHRDIKPQNFKIQENGQVKMLDFGIAKNLQTPKLTMMGYIVGTTEYMAPEQFQEKVEQKSDIWSLGVMMYEMLTGMLPFSGTNQASLVHKISKAVFIQPKILSPEVSPVLSSLIKKCLQANPSTRISAKEIITLLSNNENKKPDNTLSVKRLLPSDLKISRLHIVKVFAVVAIIFLFLLIKNTGSNSEEQNAVKTLDTASSQTTNGDAVNKIVIDAPGVSDGKIVTENGEVHKLPYQLSGKSGEKISFTLRANGYYDKEEIIEINHRRSSYEFQLQAIQK